MRMLFLGAGGTGGYFGGRAAQAGADVTFLVREPRAARIREQGLRIKSPLGDATLQPQLVTQQTLQGSYDVVVLSCKAYDLASAIEAIRPAVGPDTAVLPIMNGVLQYDVLDREFEPHRVLGGLCQINATLGPEGEVVHLGKYANIVFGERAGPARSERCVALEQALAGGEYVSRLSTDIYQDIWEKYVFLTTMAAATCLMRGTIGQIASSDDGIDIMTGLLQESQAVAAASGHAVRPEADASARKVIGDRTQPVTASMFRDLSQGLPVEADHIVGDMVRRARTLGVDATYLRTAYAHLQVYQAQRAAA
ncbi:MULTISPECIES: 2-dehydropantoate 2-reductase [Achromobacter]|uniref:2-dehydropantoate 2-reductase n=1 Tax=Alcaligenes xylosoxydans xylosoxydans TaxID=85698 RepID=A0A424WDJ3_ALCXX|nr:MULTISPECIES: 2-dehydropantoate 2-reductase [Achromobacter]MBC9906019.1 2-dehydropantoate 2-reductase [Achromobacter xylosoxidans]MBD0869745.1 2-dehydropantoate 2-reductase [Achromobacter xylosoxidans]MDH1298802.1 2-dehydropantoate 2-reductase [Achromobacter sp. GD03932]QNP85977.1 2-dehydropantoate 2-reductase [Achromobacter xylosoxidans]RPJ91322.1 2-dehydropantoate 2-reductase [Achromobacter xylosoxidans]